MHVGVCMPVCSYVCLRVVYARVKPNLFAYAIHMVPHIIKWLLRPCIVYHSYKLNYLRLLLQKD